ncbi:zinc ribbon domain-containing protein [Adlercreutzia sp. R7]|uniref:Zinc ribbon domain-containing protein n=1 Tax=Adlercreutzia wanghongyangiae TaxID=3111451 RepID=A0ABU6IJI1_9ACTN|nr:zinc ribbon domain-containing protein [Adlercreutzia sp. R7]
MFCTKCGNQMPDGSKFCTKCGAAFGGAAAPEISTGAAAAGGASGQGAPAAGAPKGAEAPARKKRTGLIVGIAAAAVVALAAVGIAVANPFAAPEPAPAPIEEPVAEPGAVDPEPEAAADAEPASADAASAGASEPTLPAVWFGAYSGNGFSLVDEYGNVTVPAVSDAVLETPFADGFSLGTWETSEYDAEWDQVHDEQTHYALFDSAGAAAVDLDPVLAATGVTGRSSVSGDVTSYADGRLVLTVIAQEAGQSNVFLVLDEQGSLAFELGKAAEGPLSAWPAADAFHDGVLLARAGLGDEYLLDTSGNVLASAQEAGAPVVSLGYGYYRKDAPDDERVYGYDGQPLFDAASVNGGDVVGGKLGYDQPGASGIVLVTAERENPYGGANKSLAGLYSVGSGTWIVPLGEDLANFGDANDDVLWVRTAGSIGSSAATDGADAAAAAATAEGGAAGASSTDAALRSAIVSASGEVVFDASMADAALAIPEDFRARYLHDGWWGICDDATSEPYALVCIQDGKFLGAIDAPQNLATYPNSEMYSV